MQSNEFQGGFEIRTATEADIPKIHEITNIAFNAYIDMVGIDQIAALKETEEDIRKDLETKLIFAAFMNGEIVGSVRLEFFEDKTAYLSRFCVDPDYQNIGIGKAIMNLVDATMKKLKIKRLKLHTASKAKALIHFYYGRGFYIDSTTKDKGYIRALLCKDYDY